MPVLELDNGERLTEVAAVLQYAADLAPEKGLAPVNGTFARSRLQEGLNFIATEIHKSWYHRFKPAVDAAPKVHFVDRLHKTYAPLNDRLAKAGWVSGDTFGVADTYLFVTPSAQLHSARSSGPECA